MTYFRFLGCIIICLTSGYFSQVILSNSLSNSPMVTIAGLLNIWGVYSTFLFFGYLSIYYANEIFKFPFSIGELNKVGIILALIIGPTLSIATYGKAKYNVSNYVECTGERKASSRYSSRTYAASEQLCLELKDR